MKTEELKALQAPIKDRYRKEPQAALVTLRAQGRIGEGIACRVDTGRALVEAGLHPATGGSGLQACSGDMLLEALVACAGVTLNAVATALGIDLRDGKSSPKATSISAARWGWRRMLRSGFARSGCGSSSIPTRRPSSRRS